MGMFGGKSFADVLGILGAGLKDASPDSQGGNLEAIQQMIARRGVDAQRQAFLQQLGGALNGSPGMPAQPGLQGPGMDGEPVGRATPATPGTPGLNINSPDLPKLALQAQLMGIPLNNLLDVMKAQQPDVRFDRGFGYNGKTGGAMGGFHPELDKGQTLTPEGAVANLPGSVQSAMQMAGGVEAAKSLAQAPFQAVQTYGQGGAPKTITALELANGGGGAGQSPAQNAADTARATAGAQADINLPQTLGSASQAISLIEQMKAHPGLDSRVGWRGALPALPGTPGADFGAMQDQLKGKIFLEAFGQLKGAGQITEVEGQKATQAIARLSNTQTRDGYLKALDDLESVINLGAERASGQAARLQPNAAGGSSRPAAAPRTSGYRSRILSVE